MTDKIVHLTEQSFDATALRKDGVPVLVDFWASWCAPCRVMDPVLEALAEELEGRVLITRVNVDEEPRLAMAARIRAVPTLVLLKDGLVKDVLVGVQSEEELRAELIALAGPAAGVLLS